MADRANDTELEEFLEAARHGDKQALDALLSRFVQPIYRFGMKMCRHPEDARDVLQDTLLAAARTVGDFRGDASVSTWLYTIARSFCIKRRRRGKHAPTEWVSLDAGEHAARASELVDRTRQPDDAAAGSQLADALAKAIDSLDPAYREVLVLRDVEGLTAPEVAEVLGLGVDAVKSRLHRARVVVRAKLAPFVETTKERPVADGCGNIAELFSQRLEGDIDAAACAEMEKHLASCARCFDTCESLKRTLAMCKGHGPEIPAEVQSQVRAALNRFLQLPA